MNRHVWVSLALILLAACGDDGGQKVPPEPTFTRVFEEVVTATRCGGPLCHGLTAGGFRMGSKDAVYTAFVGQPGGGAHCGDSGYIRVVPGDPEASLLYLKLDHRQPCGDPMPGGDRLPDEQIELVRAWIEAGAHND
jgi:hypothetical protein